MICFITVNYGTSSLITNWTNNIKLLQSDAQFIIIDNYFDEEERENVKKLSTSEQFVLIESENIGYGGALNLGIDYCLKNFKKDSFKIFAGNLDIEYVRIPKELPSGNFVYVPVIEEDGRRNRNPFLTKKQKRVASIYYIAGFTQSPIIYLLVVAINKIIGLIPSKIWAIHGSLFCFDSKLLNNDYSIFNNKSFLYGEELEFASYMESRKAKFVETTIHVKHSAHVATKNIVKERRKFLKTWWASYLNWRDRWYY
eukprot:TRINITY_DN6960_c0_g1_i1.p1 TRINITY_DN6960_c0_g1~~TRINITY_DN6960_c0_g1_i1.p1  ORF type:complete len:255 (-),score=16.31 TRINITY_DN6960_c0_g1_i1:149-913(-)